MQRRHWWRLPQAAPHAYARREAGYLLHGRGQCAVAGPLRRLGHGHGLRPRALGVLVAAAGSRWRQDLHLHIPLGLTNTRKGRDGSEVLIETWSTTRLKRRRSRRRCRCRGRRRRREPTVESVFWHILCVLVATNEMISITEARHS